MTATIQLALLGAVACGAALAEKPVASWDVPFVLPSYCEPSAYDIVQVQDMTSSFDTKWEAMSKQIGKVIDSIYATDANSRFGFATFGDKPRHNDTIQYGYDTDYCLKVDIPLGRPTAEHMSSIFADYTLHAAGGGADWPEALSDGLMRALMTKKLDWAADSKKSTRLVVVVTDAMTHLRGDLAALNDGKEVKDFALTADDVADSPNNLCGEMEYPDWQQMGDLITQRNANVIVLAAPAGEYDHDGKFTPYKPIALMGKKYREEDGLALLYQDFFLAHNVPAFVQKLNQDMSNYADAFIHQFHQFMQWQCDQSTTTVAPTEFTGTTEKDQDPDGVESTTEFPTTLTPKTTSEESTPLTTQEFLTTTSVKTTEELTTEKTSSSATTTTTSTTTTTTTSTTTVGHDGTPAPPCDDSGCDGCCGGGNLHADIHIVIDENGGCGNNQTDVAEPVLEINTDQ